MNRLILPALLTFLLGGCIIGGTGTDTENGVVKSDSQSQGTISAQVLDTAGRPMKDVELTFIDADFRPDGGQSNGLDPIKPVAAAEQIVVTDSKGQVSFTLHHTGTMVIEGSLEDQPLFFDTLRVTDVKAIASVTFKARAVRSFKGKVKLASGMHVDSGKVFIRGTRRFVKVNASGDYDLGALPVDVVRMAIGMRFTASPTAVLEVNQMLVKRDTVLDKLLPVLVGQESLKVVYTCKDLPKDSAEKISTTVSAQPMDSTSSAPGVATDMPALLDSGRVNAALQACDSIPDGAIVNVKPVESAPVSMGGNDSVSGAFLLPQRAPDETRAVVSSDVVSYSQCVDAPGTEKISFDIKLEATTVGSDLVVGDLSDKCISP